MRPDEFIAEVKSAKRRPIYLISGGEPSALAKCLAAASEAVNPDFYDFNFQKISLDEGGAGRLISEASTMPFFAPPRVIVVRNPAVNADDSARLAAYLDDPNPGSTVVLAVDKPDLRLKFFKKLRDSGAEVDCRPPKGPELVDWVIAELKSRGVGCGGPAARLVVERVGEDLGALGGEVEKLSLYSGPESSLNVETVKRLVSVSPLGNIFELGEALGRQDLPAATATLLELLSSEHPLPILAMMVRHFRILLQVKTRQASSGTTQLRPEEASSLGLHPFVVKKSLEQASRWGWKNLREALQLLESAHRSLVTSSAPGDIVLEGLAIKLGRLLAA